MFLIVAGGDPPGRNLIMDLARRARKVIAADKGAMYCLESGVTPDLVVGDMDSISSGTRTRLQVLGVSVKEFSTSKDQTDTQLALEEALSQGAREVDLVGALGGRFDHELANLHLLKKALDQGVRARIISEDQQILLVDSEFRFTDREGAMVSFLPLSGRVEGITLSGFAYDLNGAAMEIGDPYGVSNVIRAARATVRVEAGVLVAVLSKSGPQPAAGE